MRELQGTGAQIARRRSGIHQRVPQRQIARLDEAVVVSDREQRLLERRAIADRDLPLVAAVAAPCALASPRVEHLVVLGIVDDADFRLRRCLRQHLGGGIRVDDGRRLQ